MNHFVQDEDPDSSWQYLQENDLVALLNQIPLADIFRHVLQIEVINGKYSTWIHKYLLHIKDTKFKGTIQIITHAGMHKTF